MYTQAGQGIIVDAPKSQSSYRDIFVPETLIIRLKEYKEWQDREIYNRGDLWTGNRGSEGFILTTFNGNPVHGSTIRHWVKKGTDFCDVPYVTVHGLRHTYASLLIANGIDVRTAAAQLGHSSPMLVFSTYANPQNEAKERAANTIDRLMHNQKVGIETLKIKENHGNVVPICSQSGKSPDITRTS